MLSVKEAGNLSTLAIVCFHMGDEGGMRRLQILHRALLDFLQRRLAQL